MTRVTRTRAQGALFEGRLLGKYKVSHATVLADCNQNINSRHYTFETVAQTPVSHPLVVVQRQL